MTSRKKQFYVFRMKRVFKDSYQDYGEITAADATQALNILRRRYNLKMTDRIDVSYVRDSDARYITA